jgi:hypothetical protein
LRLPATLRRHPAGAGIDFIKFHWGQLIFG